MHDKLQNLQNGITTWVKRQGRQHQNTITGLSKVHKMGGPSGGGQNTHRNGKKYIKALIKQRFTQLAYGKMICGNRAKTKWEVEGYQNTRYFHAYASNLKTRNKLE